jgi:dienelactone hydrolase
MNIGKRRSSTRSAVVAAACLLLCGTGALRAQTLEVVPNHIMVDESATIRASGLQPGERVSIRGELTDGAEHRWTSEAEFVADAQGAVDTAKQAPVKGSYKEVSPLGLVWSMKPTDKDAESYVPPHELGPQNSRFELWAEGRQVASAPLEQSRVTEDMRQIQLEGHLDGVLFLPGSAGASPGVLVLGGSEGGVPLEKAAWLASHGYAALALAYFRHKTLPPELAAIPLEYFGMALNWMMQRPEISAAHIAVMGTSRGGELALQLASMFPQITAVVAYVPANVRYPSCCGLSNIPYAWTWKGQPLAYVPVEDLRSLHTMTKMKAAIEVERTHGPILLIAGDDDGVWDSSGMTGDIVSRLKGAHFAPAVERFAYPHAGHRAGRPEIVPMWHGRMRHPVSGREMFLGGSAEGDAASSIDAIEKVLQFLHTNLPAQTAPAK